MRVKLKDIASFSKGIQINGDDLLPDGQYDFLNGGIRPSGKWNAYNVNGNTVTISEGGNSSGYVNFMEAPFWCGAHCYFLFDLKIDGKYLFYALKSQQNRIMKLRSGACMPNIKKSDLAEFTFCIDNDIVKQKVVVNVLDKIDDIIGKRKQQLAKLDELVKARFAEMFGDPMINPKGFPCYTVGEVIEFQGGNQPDKKYFEFEPTPDNVRLIQIRDYKSDKYITYIPRAMAKRFCTADDIMIGRYGPPIFQILKGIEGSFNVALMKATPKMGNREFARQFLKQDCLLEYLESLSKRTAGQDGIQMDKLKAYPFPYPPIELQEQFAAFVEQTDKSKLTIQQSLDKLESLKKSLMQQYFG